MSATPVHVADRIEGALLGLAAGDALGATVEFRTAAQIAAQHGRHRDIIGGGVFRWRAGQGTDDTDLMVAVARAYAAGYTLNGVADRFLDWYAGNPRDIGTTTRAALAAYQRSRSPRTSGQYAARAVGAQVRAGNGSLMRCLPTGLVRRDARQRGTEAAEISAITHADRRCVDSCVAYVHMVAALLDGAHPQQATASALADRSLTPDVRAAISRGTSAQYADLPCSGYVLDTLTVAVWALRQPTTAEQSLVDVVNLGGDADTNGAVAGGLLGARDGTAAWPARWLDRLEYAPELRQLAGRITLLRAIDDHPPRRRRAGCTGTPHAGCARSGGVGRGRL